MGAFGRVLSIGTAVGNSTALGQGQRGLRVPIQGRLQLLSTVRLSGETVRGIAKYPRIGDPVYAAGAEVISAVLDNSVSGAEASLPLGQLSVDKSVEVRVTLSRLFGRHLAIVGVTGSGKSWTLSHLVESVAHAKGKMILIDATGEFHTLGNTVTHVTFGTADDEPTNSTVVGIPHHVMRESDRNAFLNPSSGAQLPKLREAVRSLRLSEAIKNDESAIDEYNALRDSDGTIKKAGTKHTVLSRATRKYASVIEDSRAPFDIKALSRQIQLECVWPTGRSPAAADAYGDIDYQQIAYLSTLVTRINDLIQTPEIMGVIEPLADVKNALRSISDWIDDPSAPILRISLRNLTFANNLREIVVNIIGQELLSLARAGKFRNAPLVVAIDEAHQFFDVTVGDEFSKARLNAFDSIAKEGRKYGLTACVVTQRPGDLPAGVLSQIGMTIVHRLADGRDRERIEQAAAELDFSATRLLPGLVPGEAILMGVDFPVPVSVQMRRPVHPPESDGPNYSEWNSTRYLAPIK